MNTSKNHYNQHLAAVYSWTSGTPEAAIQRNRDFFCKLGIDSIQRSLAIDLGTGPGFQAIPTSSVLLNPGVNLYVGVARCATPTYKFTPKISTPQLVLIQSCGLIKLGLWSTAKSRITHCSEWNNQWNNMHRCWKTLNCGPASESWQCNRIQQ